MKYFIFLFIIFTGCSGIMVRDGKWHSLPVFTNGKTYTAYIWQKGAVTLRKNSDKSYTPINFSPFTNAEEKMLEDEFILEGAEMETEIKDPVITLEEFDNHLERYLRITNKTLNAQIFYFQFKMCYNGKPSDFMKTYEEFKNKSRHLTNKQLTLF
jgi:hypothetical protein